MLATIAARLTDQLYFRCPLDPSKKAIYEYVISWKKIRRENN